MCELFGVTSAEKLTCNDLLREFFSHGTEHPHGWGMAFFYGNAVSLEKQPEASYKSDYLKQRLRVPIREDKMIAHIRLATKGTVDYENSHPFVMRDSSDRTWTLVHNGTIFECDALNEFVYTQHGQTDSERILCYLISRINKAQEEKGSALTQEERFSLMDEILVEITPENKVNLLVYDGELLYAHTNCEGSLHRCRKEGAVVISTQPLDHSQWERIPMNTLIAYKNGEQIFAGTDHGNSYIETPEKMRLLFMDFAGL